MNTNHFPSLELCKKLHSIWMQWTWEYWFAEWQWINFDSYFLEKTEFTSKESFYDLWKRKAEWGKWMNLGWIFIEAYSVMEMLDAAKSKNLWDDKYFFYEINNPIWNQIKIIDWDEKKIHFIISDTLPNALAEMVIWLVENNYISFTK